MIPDGPLHPEDAIAALVIGAAGGALVGHTRVAAPAVVGLYVITLALRHPDFLPEGFVERPAPLLAVVALLFVAGMIAGLVSGRLAAPAPFVGLVAVAGCGAVWSTAPDTEPALIGGLLLLAGTGFLRRAAARWAPLLIVVAPAAAVLGTVGRPDRLPFVLAMCVAASIAARTGLAVLARLNRRCQRAGTPTTVAPGATSAVTTAPAPTTAP
ncbi:MAG: hypothetical protein AAGA37_17400 [Actinomycetota bacterium]